MRFTDQPVPVAARDSDFSIRKRMPTIIQFFLLFGANFALVLIAYVFSKTMAGFAAAIFLLLATGNAFAVWNIQRARDLQLATEFQNALFASAVSLGTTFCLILRRDGGVEYADRGFQNMFPQYGKSSRRSAEDIFNMANVSKEDADKLYVAIAAETQSQHVLSIRDADGISHRVVVVVEPLRRPHDYVLLRGRPYVERV